MPATDGAPPAACAVRGTMPTIWGHLAKIDKLSGPAPHILVKTSLAGGTALRVRAKIGAETLIARGIEPVDVSDLREGEFVEVSYRYGGDGWLDADSIYVRPE
jgi:hypothetical protein